MLQSFTKRYTDESTDDQFAFTFYCDLCGSSWKSMPITFSRGKQRSFWERLLGKPSSLWKEEHNDAFERANLEGIFYFNRCTACKKWVCDDDFSEEENKCFDCCKSGKETGHGNNL